jgi:hypothetical protein
MGLIEAIVALGTEVVKLINTKEANKYGDRMVELKLEIQEEKARGYDADDAKIEALQHELKVIFEALTLRLASRGN